MKDFDHTKLTLGDSVAYSERRHRALYYRFAVVDRLTKTQIVLSDGKRFRRADGRMVGDTLNRLLDPAGPEAIGVRCRAVQERAAQALEKLHMRRVGSPRDLDKWLDQVSDVVTKARVRAADIASLMPPDDAEESHGIVAPD